MQRIIHNLIIFLKHIKRSFIKLCNKAEVLGGETVNYIYYKYLIFFNSLIKSQRLNPSLIPIVIINFNQLFYLKQLIDFLQKREFRKIVIIDNKSDYQPLLEYYNQIQQEGVIVEFMEQNAGHNVFFQNVNLQKKYGQGYYVITDADIIPNNNCPEDFMKTFVQMLDQNVNSITKVGFALSISDIPDYYPLKQKVLDWEEKYWEAPVGENIFKAHIDTTFALYKPLYPGRFNNVFFYDAFRFAGNYTAKHGGWYIDLNNPTEEYLHYQKTASGANSWKMNDKGELTGEYKDEY